VPCAADRHLQSRSVNHVASKGLCPDNPAASTINRIEQKQRKRHTIEGLKAIREKSPAWL
jgi:hypothetical protein